MGRTDGNRNAHVVYMRTPHYELELDAGNSRFKLSVKNEIVVDAPLSILVHTLRCKDKGGTLAMLPEKEENGCRVFTFEREGPGVRGSLRVSCDDLSVRLSFLPRESMKELDDVEYFRDIPCPGSPCTQSTTQASSIYVPRFDWSKGAVLNTPDTSDTLACQQWLSPPPFCYAFLVAGEWIACGIVAKPGEWNFQSFDYRAGASGFHLATTYEGHGEVEAGSPLPSLVFLFDPDGNHGRSNDCNDALRRYTDYLVEQDLVRRPERTIPSWWKQPIFCGWGEQRLQYRQRHGGAENGCWINAGDLANEQLYEHSLAVLESHGISPGTVVIDCFWSERPSLAVPDHLKWKDLRGFIDRQHAKGRKVLLWLTPIIYAGVPESCCMTIGGKPVATDPTSDEFRSFFAEQIRIMISDEPDCLDADGFKVDFTQNCPAERQTFRSDLADKWAIISLDETRRYAALGESRQELIKAQGTLWGAEIVKAYIEAIRVPLKAAKPDGLLICHAANPYITESFDMLRLNDMDGTSPDVLGIMSNRAAIAKACDPEILLDTDNDLMVSRGMWLEYIGLQEKIGVPDTYYATGIAVSGEMFGQDDYKALAEAWKRYRTTQGLPIV